MNSKEKLRILKDRLSEMDSLAVAFSGGMDSAFLLLCAVDVLGEKAFAVTARSVIFPGREAESCVEFCRDRNIRQEFALLGQDFFNAIKGNEADVCYTCKGAMFRAMLETAGDVPLADGTNADDEGDYRPGLRALRELKILSPLKDAGMTKADIQELLEEMAPDFSVPLPSACLVSRVAYGQILEEDRLLAIDALENTIKDGGFTSVRVRCHGDLARIEVAPDQIKAFVQSELPDVISDEAKRLGFKYVALDLDGYRTGSLNSSLDKNVRRDSV